MRIAFAPCALLALAACEPSAQEKPTEVTSDESPMIRQLLPQGEYRLAGADGQDVNLGHAITVSVTGNEIRSFSQCVTPRWTYRYVEDRLVTEPVIEAICDRGRYPAEEALSAVFTDPQAILITPENGLFIEGGGHSITLFSQ